MSLGELGDPKERSVDTRSPLLGVTGSWKSDGPNEEGESAIPEPPSSSRRWEAKTSKSLGVIGWGSAVLSAVVVASLGIITLGGTVERC